MADEFGGLYDKAHKLLPIFPDVVVDMSGGNGGVIEKVPPWVSSMLSESESLEGLSLSNLDNGLAQALETIAEDVMESKEKVTDYCVEFTAPNGFRHAILIYADMLPRQIAPDRIMFRLHDVSSKLQQRKEVLVLSSFHGLIGRSNAMRQVFRKIAIYGPSEAPVVVTGETGTGKELVARAIHEVSSRRAKPYVTVNCSAISDDLFESELFGHDRGSFTGANRTHRGRFERASSGTLFMDEVGDMPPQAQTKLLRVLETGQVERVGGEQPIDVDVRVVAATNVPLEEAVGQGRFRADLFHRLAVFRIHLPPLRNHREDIPLLVEHFLVLFAEKYQRPAMQVTSEAIGMLQEYTWPGNIRELKNVIERVVVETPGTTIDRNAFAEWAHERVQLVRHQMSGAYGPGVGGAGGAGAGGGAGQPVFHQSPPIAALPPAQAFANGVPPNAAEFASGQDDVDDMVIEGQIVPSGTTKKSGPLTKEDILRAYMDASANLTKAARMLGIHKATLYRQMKKLDLTREDLAKMAKERKGETA